MISEYWDDPDWQKANAIYKDPPGEPHDKLMFRLQATQVMLRIELRHQK